MVGKRMEGENYAFCTGCMSWKNKGNCSLEDYLRLYPRDSDIDEYGFHPQFGYIDHTNPED